MKKNIIILISLTIIFGISVFAGGAGGLLFGAPLNVDFLGGNTYGGSYSYFGGWGYGVTNDNYIIGGFGFSIRENGYPVDSLEGLTGGVGGLISGYQLASNQLFFSNILIYSGLGGVTKDVLNTPEDGYLVVFAEISLEIGFKITPWFYISGYAGYQGFGNLLPGNILKEFTLRSPVYGVRISWGAI